MVAALNLPPAGPPPARANILKPFTLSSGTPTLDPSSKSSNSKKQSTSAGSSGAAPAATVSLGSSQAYALFAAERFVLLCASLATALQAPPPAPTQSSGAVPVGAILLLLEMVASVSPGNRNDNSSSKGSSSGAASLASTLVGDADGAIPAVAMRALLPNLRHASLHLAQSLLTIPGLCPGPLMCRARRLSAVVRRLVEPSLPPPMPTSQQAPGALTQPTDLALFLRSAISTTRNSDDDNNSRGLPLACALLCQMSGSFGSGAALELVAMPNLSQLVHGIAYALTVIISVPLLLALILKPTLDYDVILT